MPELGPIDPFVLAAAAALLFTTALCACAIPAMRAMRVDPRKMLKADG